MSIEARDVAFSYDGERPVLRSVSFSVGPGELCALVGPSGSGKSTLLLLLAGLDRPERGAIRVFGADPARRDPRTQAPGAGQPGHGPVRAEIALVLQQPERQFFNQTVEAEIAFSLKRMGLSPQEIDERVARALHDVGLPPDVYLKRSPFHLSGGEQRAVAIAVALALSPRALLLDEPTAGLDPATARRILDQLDAWRRAHHAPVILVTHDMAFAGARADRLLALSQGEAVFFGRPAAFFREKALVERLGLDEPAPSAFLRHLCEQGLEVPYPLFDVEEAAAAVAGAVARATGTAGSLGNARSVGNAEGPRSAGISGITAPARCAGSAGETGNSGSAGRIGSTEGTESTGNGGDSGNTGSAGHSHRRRQKNRTAGSGPHRGYLDVPGPLHPLDPRAKTLGTLFLLAGVFALESWWGYAAISALLLLAAAYGKIPLARLTAAVRGISFLLFFTVVVNGLFSPGEPLAQLGPLTLTDRGLVRGTVLGMRLVLIVGATTLLTAVTKPLDLAYALGWILGPFRLVRVPVSELAMVTSIALRFIPVLSAEAQRIQLAQKARGIGIEDRPLKRALSLAPIIVPLFAGALRQADELGLALEARGYVPGKPRTRLHPLQFRTADAAFLAACAALALVAWLWL